MHRVQNIKHVNAGKQGIIMRLEYKLGEYLVKVLPNYYYEQVLRFYQENQLHFDVWETKKEANFYTEHYQKALLEAEYNAMIKGTMARYYIFKKDNLEKIIGAVNFHDIKRGSFMNCQIGYKIHHEYCNQGIGKYVVNSLIKLWLPDSGLHRIEALIHPENAPSISLAEQVGFKREGLLREVVLLGGQWQDMYRYGLVRNENIEKR